MSCAAHVRQIFLGAALAGCLVLGAGCGKSTATLDERDEQDPLMESAKQRERADDIDGAIDLYKEALDNNPRLAKAHLQIGLLSDQHQDDFIGAIYHYRRYLELRPDAEKREFIEELIRLAELSYATSLPDQPSEAIKQLGLLREEKDATEEALDKARLTIRQQKAAMNELRRKLAQASSGSPPQGVSGVGGGSARDTSRARPGASAEARTYTVRSGDNLSRIAARVYNDRNQWRRILEANRDTLRRPEDLKVGQVLVIPGE